MADETREQRYDLFRDIGRDIFVSGLISSHGGNLSTREGARIYITRTGSQVGRLNPADIVEVPFEAADTGAVADKKASVELVVHRALYHRLPDVCAVAHTHSPYTVLASLLYDTIEPLDSEARFFIPNVPVVTAKKTIGSAEVAALIPATIEATGCPVAILRGHGPFATGASLEEAYRWVSVLEGSCRLIIEAARTGLPLL
jgi:L-fuculose-phosphate aldolase